ncbi:hypothetical protein LV84_00716 [Algoriphagus ratkowskyi]|uniref:Uncharacterized protein n=1 Tax=Algoriphagus ratkowskyi TaxID=57028 RepID=A0A2W7RZ39_9BACT|nr:hypothetical protein [Algoriphagus ratkowskyi]PZX60437.1 hypothetical protein LV84_00716 [Algoriphagus ratkowskyi]TXD78246.1 hypothetical protein ESW18_09415 [Algoriphagus ratkowskyi]
MQDIQLQEIWKSYDRKLEEQLVFNRKNASDITKMKVKSELTSMRPIKIFTVLLGILWIIFLDVLVINLLPIGNLFFLISAGFISLVNKIAVGIYLYQLILIYVVNINRPVMSTQKKIAGLTTSTLWVTRILMLQLPFWTTFFLNSSWIGSANPFFWGIQALITLAFAAVSIWLFINIRYENRDKPWFKFLFGSYEWTPIMKAQEMLVQIKDYEKLEPIITN